MKKYAIILLSVLFIFGCTDKPRDKKILAKVNNYEISEEEFEEEFKASLYGNVDTLESRNEFLNNMIDRKLILQNAQREGLDKDESFLKMIERFWEQSLLKLSLDKKTKEIAGSRPLVTDKMIKDEYDKLLKEGKADRAYDQMYNQIKWELTKDRESQLINDWICQLHKKAKIRINYDLLKTKMEGIKDG